MQVEIKKLDIDMFVKNNGIEFEVKTSDGSRHLGDCYLTKAGLIWCEGKTTRQKGISVSWEEFIAWMKTKQ